MNDLSCSPDVIVSKKRSLGFIRRAYFILLPILEPAPVLVVFVPSTVAWPVVGAVLLYGVVMLLTGLIFASGTLPLIPLRVHNPDMTSSVWSYHVSSSKSFPDPKIRLRLGRGCQWRKRERRVL